MLNIEGGLGRLPNNSLQLQSWMWVDYCGVGWGGRGPESAVGHRFAVSQSQVFSNVEKSTVLGVVLPNANLWKASHEKHTGPGLTSTTWKRLLYTCLYTHYSPSFCTQSLLLLLVPWLRG